MKDMKEILQEADEVNGKKVSEDLKRVGDAYERAQDMIERGKLECKSLIDEGKEIGITKGMIETYIAMKNYTELNKFAIMGAIEEKE